MTPPSLPEIFATIEATWPARRVIDLPGWQVRDGAGGGNRVAAATATAAAPDPAPMEAAQANLGQEPLVMIRPGDEPLDRRLAGAGYDLRDPVTVYLARVADLALDPPRVSAFQVAWPPMQVQRELWAAGGIGPARIAVMDRVEEAKCAILGRTGDQPAGTAFVAGSGRMAVLHALEVSPRIRRRGTARNIMRGAAHWARDAGARWMAVLVTDANAPANALYASLGMSPAGHYHYRVKRVAEKTG
ncbi:GNAT family N-acetyltransferase [Tropicimonas sp.]|uniref:GNAT family N-acetyltransferase n=1 Tax=Tropicimonas sp. TaxID=2067044 RepID=UPI003A881DAB